MARGDKSVTVAEPEKNILQKYHTGFPRPPMGAAFNAETPSEFRFRLFPNGEFVNLKIVHPKRTGNETRIYFSNGSFHPKPLEFWFLYERENEIWIGSMEDVELNRARTGQSVDFQNGYDQENEEDYQASVNSTHPALVSSTTLRYSRDPSVAQQALTNSGYVCELMPGLRTFTSKVTSNPYLEAHHFFPMMEQRHFPDQSLDVVQNICILNPYAHKMLHHATYSEIEAHLKRLAEPRESFLNDLGISVDRVLKSYGGP